MEKRSLRQRNRQAALQSFDIWDGECVVLCGRSGAGKTTVLRLINGLAPAFYEGTLHELLSEMACDYRLKIMHS